MQNLRVSGRLLKQKAEIIAEYSILLIEYSANTNRAIRNVNRLAAALDVECHLFYSFSSVVLTVENEEDHYTLVKYFDSTKVNLQMISDISTSSWRALEEGWSIDQIQQNLIDLKDKKTYAIGLKCLAGGLAGFALCRIFEGSFAECGITFLATTMGFMVRHFFATKSYNFYMCQLFAAFVSISLVNVFRTLGFEVHSALATCILWMIPGVPLINGLIDILNSHILPGLSKFISAMLIIFMIALAFIFSLLIFGYDISI